MKKEDTITAVTVKPSDVSKIHILAADLTEGRNMSDLVLLLSTALEYVYLVVASSDPTLDVATTREVFSETGQQIATELRSKVAAMLPDFPFERPTS